VHLLAVRLGWWSFPPAPHALLGVPVELYLGWALLWGPAAALAMPRAPVVVLAAVALWADVLLMPRLAPVVRLGPAWLAGDAVAVAVCLLPAQLLARWTAEGRRLGARAALQVLCAGALLLGVMPAAVLEQTGGSWRALLDGRPAWVTSSLLQLLAVPAVLGLGAVHEFVRRGGGTPVPFDPPRRLVTSGPYAYVANPMQLSAALVLAGWGAMLGSPWVAAGALAAVAYSVGIAAWDEGDDMRGRFGDAWLAYRRAVRPWLPRWRPYYRPTDGGAAPATLYVAASCVQCSEVGRWIAARRPVGLALVPAERHPGRDLERITYDPGDGGAEEEGVAAVARALEHLNLGWALLATFVRLPAVRPLLQLVVDASGGGPQLVRRASAATSTAACPFPGVQP